MYGDPWPSAGPTTGPARFGARAQSGTAEKGCWEGSTRRVNSTAGAPARRDRIEPAAGEAVAVGHYYGPPLTGLWTECYPAGPVRQGSRRNSPHGQPYAPGQKPWKRSGRAGPADRAPRRPSAQAGVVARRHAAQAARPTAGMRPTASRSGCRTAFRHGTVLILKTIGLPAQLDRLVPAGNTVSCVDDRRAAELTRCVSIHPGMRCWIFAAYGRDEGAFFASSGSPFSGILPG